MVDSNISHEVEDRLRNIESHMGIGHTDEDGNYHVDQHQAVDQPAGTLATEEPDQDEE